MLEKTRNASDKNGSFNEVQCAAMPCGFAAKLPLPEERQALRGEMGMVCLQ